MVTPCYMPENFTHKFSSSCTLDPSTVYKLADFKTFMKDSALAICKIADEAQDVTIELDMINLWTTALIKTMLQNEDDELNEYLTVRNVRFVVPELLISDDIEKMIDYVFVLNALNFNLWNSGNEKHWTIYNRSGYKALHIAFARALEERRPIWNPSYYSNIAQEELEIIFRGDDEKICIPLIHERVRTLREIGKVLLDNYGGSFVNCIKACDGDALKLRCLLYNKFESYRDTVHYEGKKVHIGCKAAALISDLGYLNKITGDTHWISTILTDYAAPRALVDMGILRYSDRLTTKLTKRDVPLKHGSREDMEIRCCSLVACQIWAKVLSITCKDCMKNVFMDRTLVNKFLVNRLNIQYLNLIDNCVWFYRHVLRKKIDDVPLHNIISLHY